MPDITPLPANLPASGLTDPLTVYRHFYDTGQATPIDSMGELNGFMTAPNFDTPVIKQRMIRPRWFGGGAMRGMSVNTDYFPQHFSENVGNDQYQPLAGLEISISPPRTMSSVTVRWTVSFGCNLSDNDDALLLLFADPTNSGTYTVYGGTKRDIARSNWSEAATTRRPYRDRVYSGVQVITTSQAMTPFKAYLGLFMVGAPTRFIGGTNFDPSVRLRRKQISLWWW